MCPLVSDSAKKKKMNKKTLDVIILKYTVTVKRLLRWEGKKAAEKLKQSTERHMEKL